MGVFLVPQLQKQVNLRGMLLVAGAAAILGFLLTMVLPEPARRSLEEVSGEDADNMTIPALDLPTVDLIPGAQIPTVDLIAAQGPRSRLSRLTADVARLTEAMPEWCRSWVWTAAYTGPMTRNSANPRHAR